jgi:peptide/nickel transport system permease protein
MTTFLIRRLLQMFVVIVLSALVTYGILYIAPGGPVAALLGERQNAGADRVTADDIARVRARFELDLYGPYRFSRWLIGQPLGPLRIGDQTFFADLEVGCAVPGQVRLSYPDGRVEFVQEGCEKPVTLADLEGRRASVGIMFGDLGTSQVILRDRPVSVLVESRLWYTLGLMGSSILLSILIAIPVGIYSAVRQYSTFDNVVTTVTFIGSSVPTLVLGVFAILIFAVLAKDAGLPYLPPGNAVANRDYVIPLIGEVQAESTLDRILHFIMPCAVLTFVNIAGFSRFIRNSMLEVLRNDYVRTARAKGVREQLVVLKHALRNSLIPFITLLAGVLPALFAGAVITESVFNWPGLGRLLVDSLGRNDYNVAMGLTFVTIVLQMIGYLISDILYTVADPRIRLS